MTTTLSQKLRDFSAKGYNSGRFNKIDVDTLLSFAKEAEAMEGQAPVDANEQITNAAMRRLKEVMAQRTEILEAFIAKYGWDPEHTQQVIQNMEDGSQRYYVAIKPSQAGELSQKQKP